MITTPDWPPAFTAARGTATWTRSTDKKERLAGPHGLIYTFCSKVDKRDPDELPLPNGSSIGYNSLFEVVDTLLGKADAGYLALLYLLVASKLLAALEPWMSGEMRRIFANNRRNARGDSCSKKLDQKVKAGCSGVLDCGSWSSS